MKTYLASLLFLCMSWHCYVQETVQDSITIIKNDTIVVERTFQKDLKTVYSDKDFQSITIEPGTKAVTFTLDNG